MTKVAPFRMIGNLYFVGTKEASSHLIDTGDGLILIDTGYEETADAIVESMEILGFQMQDVKIILHSHGHLDHTDGTAKLLRLAPEAKTYLSFRDIRYIKGFTPDYDILDGDVIKLGNTEIECLFTPGHTEGSVSFFLDVVEDGKTYRAAMFGGSGVKQLRKEFMDGWRVPYLCRGQFFDSVERLLKIPVDVMIGNHTWQNHTLEKGAMMETATVNPFIDPTEWGNYLARLHAALWRTIDADKRNRFVCYTRCGRSANSREDCVKWVERGIQLGANGVLASVERAQDGTLVLSETATAGTGLPLSLESFLTRFSSEPLTLSLQLKEDGLEVELAEYIYRFGVEKRTVFTSDVLARLQAIKARDAHLRVGYFAGEVDNALLQKLVECDVDEIGLRASRINEAEVIRLHRIGFNVCVYGEVSEAEMQGLYDAGVDGITTVLPDAWLETAAKSNEEKGIK